MPENEFPKLKPHPFRQPEAPAAHSVRSHGGCSPYAELCVTSNYTFLTGASHPEEFVTQAAAMGYHAVAITDTHTLAGVVRAHVAAKEAGIRFVLGSRLRLTDMPGCSVFVYPTGMDSYRRLCRLLTVGKRRAPKGECHLVFEDLSRHAEGLLGIVALEGESTEAFEAEVGRLRELFSDDRLSLAMCAMYGPDDGDRLQRTADLSARTGMPLVATNDAHYHHPDRRMLHDVVTCIRHGCTLAQAGFRLHANAERHLKPPEDMHRLFAAHPQALARTIDIADRTSGFSLDGLRYEYPDETVPHGRTPQQHLIGLAWAGAQRIYADQIPEKVRSQIAHELRLIGELNYAPYFLTVHDLVRYARTGEERPGEPAKGDWAGPILCQGRGAAANSAVCYCLGVTAVDPARINLLFERFMSKERNEPPDIDIDFEHERREEVIQYIYRKYGRERAALTAEVITYRRRSAVRDLGKALGLSLDLVDRLAKDIEWFDKGVIDPARLRELGLDPADPTLQWLVRLVGELLGFPRHLSQHVGGFVITRSSLCELVPVENAAMPDRTVIEWDKDDIDAVGMLKVDVLGLGMLTCIRKAFEEVNGYRAEALSIFRIMSKYAEDPAVYGMIQRADTIGVFQIESRAQMSMLPRLKPREFYDLVIEVAIVRPGPIQGKMVHPYLRRRSGQEQVTFPNPDIERVLGRTLGVPLFQEQAMQLAIVAGGFTPDEADQLRRAMAAWKRKGDLIHRFGERLVGGMIARGYPAEFAARCFEQIKGFSEYGFPESHAASFAILVYVSCWLKRHEPAAFAAALINSQPMGFYQPAQIVRDAREHGVEVRPIDVNHSRWDCTLEERHEGTEAQRNEGEARESHSVPSCLCASVPSPALRLGMRLVKGLSQADADRICGAVEKHGAFTGIQTLWRAAGASVRGMRCLARADAFGSMNMDRQAALWVVRTLRDVPPPLFDGPASDGAELFGSESLPTVTAPDRTFHDYAFTGLSLRAHPFSFLRPRLKKRGACLASELRDPVRWPEGKRVRVAGVVLVRQRPATASGVVFITLEDESGTANLVVWSDTYERFRRAICLSRALLVEGRVEREGGVVHMHARRFKSLDEYLPALESVSRDFH